MVVQTLVVLYECLVLAIFNINVNLPSRGLVNIVILSHLNKGETHLGWLGRVGSASNS